jgi:hypothetical protein
MTMLFIAPLIGLLVALLRGVNLANVPPVPPPNASEAQKIQWLQKVFPGIADVINYLATPTGAMVMLGAYLLFFLWYVLYETVATRYVTVRLLGGTAPLSRIAREAMGRLILHLGALLLLGFGLSIGLAIGLALVGLAASASPGLAVLLGLGLLIVACYAVLPLWIMPPLVSSEPIGVTETIVRSFRLCRGNVGHLTVTMLLAGLAVMAVTMVASMFAGVVGIAAPSLILVVMVLSWLAALMLNTAIQCATYVDLWYREAESRDDGDAWERHAPSHTPGQASHALAPPLDTGSASDEDWEVLHDPDAPPSGDQR